MRMNVTGIQVHAGATPNVSTHLAAIIANVLKATNLASMKGTV
jgi:hypothetical protein